MLRTTLRKTGAASAQPEGESVSCPDVLHPDYPLTPCLGPAPKLGYSPHSKSVSLQLPHKTYFPVGEVIVR